MTRRHLFTVPGFSSRRGFCRGKSREWFATHGLDWKAFLREGIDADLLVATGDGLALALVQWAVECDSADRGLKNG